MYEDFRKKGTLEEAIKRIQQINEYIYEADPQGGMLNDADNDNQEQPEEQEPEQAPKGQPVPRENGEQMPHEPLQEPSGQPDAGIPDMESSEQNMPDTGAGMAEPMEPGDEVIDVDDLTNKQEETSEQLDGVDRKLTDLAGVLDKFIMAIKNNDEKIDSLKKEFERRNPTEEEKADIRTGQGGPYSQKPEDAWKKLDSRMHDGNLIAPDKEKVYTITLDDVNSGRDLEVADSFDDYPKDLVSYFA